MNLIEKNGISGQEATLDFGHGEFRVVRQGSFVRCAISGNPIRLEDLKYWSVDRQEAYATPEAALLRVRREGRP
jgi:hypothetical protein